MFWELDERLRSSIGPFLREEEEHEYILDLDKEVVKYFDKYSGEPTNSSLPLDILIERKDKTI